MIFSLVAGYRVNYGSGLLCRRCAVEVDERLPVDRLVKRREISTPIGSGDGLGGRAHYEKSSSE